MTYRVTAKKGSDVRPDRFAWTDEEAEELFGTRVQKKYNPNQPRHPKGHPKGGHWSGGNGSAGGSGGADSDVGEARTVVDSTGRTREFGPEDSLYPHLVLGPDGEWRVSDERQNLHDRIIQDVLGGVEPADGQPEFYMTGGGPASGKSTMLEAGSVSIPGDDEAVTVNADHIKDMIPEYVKGLAERNPAIAGFVHDEGSLLSQRLRLEAAERGLNVVYDTTGNGHTQDLINTVNVFKKAGYRTTAYYASLDTELAAKINKIRFEKTGRLVPDRILRETHANVSRGFIRYAREAAFDEIKLYDTNIQGKPRLVAQGSRGRLEIVNRSLFSRFLRKGLSSFGTIPLANPDLLPDPVQVRREDHEGPTTTELTKLVTEILGGKTPDESSLDMTEEMLDIWKDVEDQIAQMPEGAIVDPGNEYDSFDYRSLYEDRPLGEIATKSHGNLAEHEKWVRIKQVDQEKQIVYGEVYAPGMLDTYGEFMTADDIETMAHRFMQLDLRAAIDTQHDNIPNGAYPVESFIARENDPDYTEGSWVMGVKIPDQQLWQRVKSGELNGFSFQSLVRPAEVEVDYEVTRDHVGKTESQDDHTHAYYVELDEVGNVVRGITSRAADGHFHEIERASTTEAEHGHSHRFFL